MKPALFFFAAVCLWVASCTKEKTDYQAGTNGPAAELFTFKEAVSISADGYHISIEVLNGTFYTGYNEIRLRIQGVQNNKEVSSVSFLPVMTTADTATSCPHRYKMIAVPDSNYFSGYAVFSAESSVAANWELYVGFTTPGGNHLVKQRIVVEEQPNLNLNMTRFTGNDNEQYYIALVAPQQPKVAENTLVAGIYKYNIPAVAPSEAFPDPSQFSYTEVSGYILQLDPRMPEPSMGNHSSPNNKDLTQQPDGLYHGIVNYTMTGNWTLNFILLNHQGRIVKGTQVPDDFTPGAEGVKSELYIDILF